MQSFIWAKSNRKVSQLKIGDVSSAVKVLMLLPAHCAGSQPSVLRRAAAPTTAPAASSAAAAVTQLTQFQGRACRVVLAVLADGRKG